MQLIQLQESRAAILIFHVTKALVEATPISGPAFVKSVKSDSRQIELFATLHMESEIGLPVFFANFNEDKVSAVSPDCDIVIKRVFFVFIGSWY